MRQLIIVFFLFTSSYMSNAQGWEDVSGGVDDNVYDMIKYDGELFVAGRFLFEVKSWDGATWTDYNGLYGIGSPLTLSILDDTLYVAGDFAYGGSQSTVYKLVNGNWEQVGGVFNESSWSSTKKLITYDTLLISGGRFSSVGGVSIDNIASWNGTTWSAMGAGLNGIVTNLGVHQDTLYATGDFTASGSDTTVRTIAKWNGANWVCFDNNVTFNSAGALKTYQGDLLIGNVWDTINGIEMNGIARWDGTNYSSMGTPIIKGVHEFWQFNNDLYIAADLNGSGIPSIERAVMKWNGADWEQVGGLFNQWVMCLEDYDNMLYCGGQFTDPTSHIGRFNPSLGINEYNIDKKEVIKIVDLMGRETKPKPNTIIIYIYSDGTTQKIFNVE